MKDWMTSIECTPNYSIVAGIEDFLTSLRIVSFFVIWLLRDPLLSTFHLMTLFTVEQMSILLQRVNHYHYYYCFIRFAIMIKKRAKKHEEQKNNIQSVHHKRWQRHRNSWEGNYWGPRNRICVKRRKEKTLYMKHFFLSRSWAILLTAFIWKPSLIWVTVLVENVFFSFFFFFSKCATNFF